MKNAKYRIGDVIYVMAQGTPKHTEGSITEAVVTSVHYDPKNDVYAYGFSGSGLTCIEEKCVYRTLRKALKAWHERKEELTLKKPATSVTSALAALQEMLSEPDSEETPEASPSEDMVCATVANE